MSVSLHGKARSGIIGFTLLALVTTWGVSPAMAEDTSEMQGEAEQVANATQSALDDLGESVPVTPFQETNGVFTSMDDSVEVSGAVVEMNIAGTTNVELILPVEGDPVTTSDGTLVFAGQEAGLHVEVQPVDEGVARVLTVADESYTSEPTHEYTYQLSLPAGAACTSSPQARLGSFRT